MGGRLIDSIRPSDAVWCSTNPYTQHRQAYSEKCTLDWGWLQEQSRIILHLRTSAYIDWFQHIVSLDTLDWVNPQFSFCFRHEDLQPPKFNLNESQRDLLKFSSRRIGSWESVVHRSRTNLAKRWCAGNRYSFLETRPYKIIQDLIWQDVANMVFKFITTCRKAFRTHLIDQRPAWWHVQRTDTQ